MWAGHLETNNGFGCSHFLLILLGATLTKHLGMLGGVFLFVPCTVVGEREISPY